MVAFGATVSSNAMLRLNQPPIADASATKRFYISCNGTSAPVILDGSRSLDPDGDSLSIVADNNPGDWQWIGSGQSASYTYTIDDGQGGQAAASVTVYVEEEEYSPTNSAPTT